MSPKIEAKVETITPDRARKLMDKTTRLSEQSEATWRQRSIKKSKVDDYAKDMRAGNWQLNGESIILTDEGRVLDGQHRLYACIKADVPFQTIVSRGAQEDSFRTIDTGAVRTAGDIFTIAGRKSGRDLAAAAAVVWKYEKGSGRLLNTMWHERPTKTELFQTIEQHPGLEEYVSKSGSLAPLLSHGLVAALWYLFAKRDPLLSDSFFDMLRTGSGLREGEPIHALRERVQRDRALRPRPTQQHTAELIVRAWNATRTGKKLGKMQKGHQPLDLAIR